MSLVQGYSSDEDAGTVTAQRDAFNLAAVSSSKRLRVQDVPMNSNPHAAPDVLAQDPLNQTSLITRPTDTQMNVNIPYSDMMLPVQGPENPFGDRNRFMNQNALVRPHSM